MKTIRDKVRTVCHALKMDTLMGVDPKLRLDISSRISSLPSPEKIESMGSSDLKDMAKISERLMFDLDRSKNGRTTDHAIRHMVDKGIPPRMSPILGYSENWYKKASGDGFGLVQKIVNSMPKTKNLLLQTDYSKALSPGWTVEQLNKL